MSNYIYILVILYNLNLLINAYVEVMITNITIFNYKNTTKFSINSFFYDILLNYYYKSLNFNKIVVKYTIRENSLMVKPQSSKLLLWVRVLFFSLIKLMFYTFTYLFYTSYSFSLQFKKFIFFTWKPSYNKNTYKKLI